MIAIINKSLILKNFYLFENVVESREKPRQDGKNPSRVPSEKVK